MGLIKLKNVHVKHISQDSLSYFDFNSLKTYFQNLSSQTWGAA